MDAERRAAASVVAAGVLLVKTEAWAIRSGDGPGALERIELTLRPPGPHEVLVEPLYGSWEANMSHAIARRPVDVCKMRNEPFVVLGNSGVGRVVACGPGVTLAEGDVCLYALPHEFDPFGYPERLMGFDRPNVHGLLARRGLWRAEDLHPLPKNTRHSLRQWAAFSVRFLSAWSSWKVAHGAWRLQMDESDQRVPYVFGWGGGTTLATLQLARLFGADATMVASSPARLEQIESLGIHPLDRRDYLDLVHDETRMKDPAYAARYREAERRFLRDVRGRTEGRGASIFFDYIGTPVLRATLKALARQGVLATAGWLEGRDTNLNRARECVSRHIHVHTHGYRRQEVAPAVAFAEANDWVPTIHDEERVYTFDGIDELAEDFAAGRVTSYFPVFEINPA